MLNYRMTVQYDGTRWRGWQVLKDTDNTIQGRLQAVLSRATGQPVEVIGSGRTDAGVHSLGQTANFHMEEAAVRAVLTEEGLTAGREVEALLAYLNRYLPEDIAVTELCEAPERFHARFSAVKKTYRYRIRTSPVPDVFTRQYTCTYTDAPLDEERMREAAALLTGTHDFASFCGNKHMKKSTVRTVYSIDLSRQGSELVLDFTGDGFLQGMVRILTGTLIEVGSGRRSASSMPELLAAKDRSLAGYTAPAKGLCLLKVYY